jgi:hypothetical protein
MKDAFPLSQANLQKLLAGLAWKYVTDVPSFDHYQPFDSLDREEQRTRLFDFSGRVWFHEHGMPTGDDLANFKIESLEAEVRQYEALYGRTIREGVGLTFTECWASYQLAARQKTYLFIQKPYESQLEDVVTRIGVSSEQLVWLVAAICKQYDPVGRRLAVIVSDGEKSHTIYVSGLSGIDFRHPKGPVVEGSWFTFHDPWPARSLLAPERGYGCVEVLEDVLLPPQWLISAQDLNRVIVGFCLPQSELSEWHMLFKTFNSKTQSHLDNIKLGIKQPFWTDSLVGPQPFALLLAMIKATGGTRLMAHRAQGLQALSHAVSAL